MFQRTTLSMLRHASIFLGWIGRDNYPVLGFFDYQRVQHIYVSLSNQTVQQLGQP